jgi:hypothetical protein
VLGVPAIFKRSFGEPRRIALLCALLGLGIMASLPAAAPSRVHLTPTPVASAPWLVRLNQWRTSTGLSTLTENSVWSQGDYDHSLYMVKNDLVTHYETPGVPYYTTAGDAAAQNGNIEVSATTSTTDTYAIDWWMAAPFHAMGMMDPRLTQTGFGSYREVKSGWDAGFTLDTIRGNSFQGGSYPVYFPGNGSTEPLTTYFGGEYPDPLQACKPYTAPTGLPIFIEIGSNVNTTAGLHHRLEQLRRAQLPVHPRRSDTRTAATPTVRREIRCVHNGQWGGPYMVIHGRAILWRDRCLAERRR